MSFTLSCESTVDVPYSYMQERNIPVLFYSYTVDGEEYVDDMGRDPKALPRFYRFIDEGKLPATSQINLRAYLDFLEPLVKEGDLLHIAFGSGMSASVNNAMLAAKQLRDKYPDRKIVVVDSLCSCSGYGLIVDYAADLRDEGKSLAEIELWLMENRNKVHHQFFSTDMRMFRRSGRVSGPAATIASILGICPIMRLDDGGRIVAYDKVRGKSNAIKRTLDEMEKHAQDGSKYSGKCFLAHSNCLDLAAETFRQVNERFPNLRGKIKLLNIGTIIASHCGPGTLSIYFMGDDRKPLK